MVKKYTLALLIAAVTMIATGCSGSSPSDSDVEEAVAIGYGTPFTTVANVERVNGYAENDHYVVDVAFDLEFTESLDSIAQRMKGPSSMMVFGLKMKFGQFNAGDVIQMNESVNFFDTENGWEARFGD